MLKKIGLPMEPPKLHGSTVYQNAVAPYGSGSATLYLLYIPVTVLLIAGIWENQDYGTVSNYSTLKTNTRSESQTNFHLFDVTIKG
jgi:hypothetical protein